MMHRSVQSTVTATVLLVALPHHCFLYYFLVAYPQDAVQAALCSGPKTGSPRPEVAASLPDIQSPLVSAAAGPPGALPPPRAPAKVGATRTRLAKSTPS